MSTFLKFSLAEHFRSLQLCRTGTIQPLRGVKAPCWAEQVGISPQLPTAHCLPAQYMDEAYDSMVDVGILKRFVTMAGRRVSNVVEVIVLYTTL